MHPFIFEEVWAEMNRREENLRRAQQNGTAYEYTPKRQVSWSRLWRRPARQAEAPAPRGFSPSTGKPAAGAS